MFFLLLVPAQDWNTGGLCSSTPPYEAFAAANLSSLTVEVFLE